MFGVNEMFWCDLGVLGSFVEGFSVSICREMTFTFNVLLFDSGQVQVVFLYFERPEQWCGWI